MEEEEIYGDARLAGAARGGVACRWSRGRRREETAAVRGLGQEGDGGGAGIGVGRRWWDGIRELRRRTTRNNQHIFFIAC
jgi:hypothetical protein